MKGFSLRVLIGALFSAVGLVTLLITKEVLTAAIWLSFGNGLILSDLRFTATDNAGRVYERPIPKSRLFAALFLIILAVLLLMLQVYLDFSQNNQVN